MQKVDDVDLWDVQAYTVEDRDGEAYTPWGLIFWLLTFPVFLYLNLY